MREHFTAAEIAAVAPPALPGSLRGLDRLIEREGWRRDQRRARQRPDGAWEYHLSLLPAEVQARLVAAERAAPPAEDDARRRSAWERFDRLPETLKSKARERLALLDRIELLAQGMPRRAAVAMVAGEAKVSSSSLWQWLRAADAVARCDRLPALAPRYAGRRDTEPCDPRAWDFLVADYLRPEQPSFAACHRRMSEAAALHGWAPLPSAKSLSRRLARDIPRGAMTLARNGAEAAKRIYPHQRRDRSVFRALEAVNADGHRFDVFCKFDDGTIGRPLMIAVQDLYSGLILGHRLARSENWSAVRHAFADVIESFGIPEQCWLDNGRSFASKWLTGGMKSRYRFKLRDDEPAGLLTQLGVAVHWTTPYHGQAKPIERAFRDLCEEIAKHPACAGAYTGNAPGNKPDNYGSRAVPIDEFRALVAREIVRHNTRPGRRAAACAGRSFAETFRVSLEAPGALTRRASAEQRRMFLLAAEGLTAQKPTGELQLGDNRYWAEPLAALIGAKLIARFDPDDLMAPLAVYARDGRFICEAPCIAATGFADTAAAAEHARIKRAWFKNQRETLWLERRLGIAEVAKQLPAPEMPAPPRPAVIKLVAGSRHPIEIADEPLWSGAGSLGRAAALLEAGEVLPFRTKETGDSA